MRFVARVITPDNRIEAQGVEAADAAAARVAIEGLGLRILAIEPASRRGAAGRRQGLELLEFSQELVALLRAGLNIVEAIEGLLAKGGSADEVDVLQSLLKALRDGKRLSDALQDRPEVFPPLYAGLVRSAEGTSNLPGALTRYVDYGLRIRALKARVLSASIYPAILLLAGAAVSVFLMTYVVPRFASVYEGSGRSMPWQSAWLLSWGQWLSANAALASALAAGGLVLLVYGFLALQRAGLLQRLLQQLPWLGERVALLELTRTYLTLGMLLEGGIPIRSALGLVAEGSSSACSRALQEARELVSGGAALSDALSRTGLCTPIALRLLRVGERSGQLGPMLTQAANFHEAETTRWIERFSRLVEPALTVIIGLVIGVIVVMLYIPILDIAGGL
jgi:general secretion pathway protein F